MRRTVAYAVSWLMRFYVCSGRAHIGARAVLRVAFAMSLGATDRAVLKERHGADAIVHFSGAHEFLSNFHRHAFIFDGAPRVRDGGARVSGAEDDARGGARAHRRRVDAVALQEPGAQGGARAARHAALARRDEGRGHAARHRRQGAVPATQRRAVTCMFD